MKKVSHSHSGFIDRDKTRTKKVARFVADTPDEAI